MHHCYSSATQHARKSIYQSVVFTLTFESTAYTLLHAGHQPKEGQTDSYLLPCKAKEAATEGSRLFCTGSVMLGIDDGGSLIIA